MRHRFGRATVRALVSGAVVITSLADLQPAAAIPPVIVHVPCSVSALAADLAGATSGQLFSLAPFCDYQLTAPLPSIQQDLTIRGNQATLERSYAPGTPFFTILTVDPNGLLVTNDLNVRNGTSGLVNDGTLTVTGGTFTDNSDAIDNFYGTLTVNGTVFTANYGQYSGVVDNEAAMTVTGATFAHNTERGIWNDDTATVTRSSFRNNLAPFGAGIYNTWDMTVIDGSFTDNTAFSGAAIASSNPTRASLTVTGTAFTGNTADTGGAICNNDGLSVSNASFTNNTAAYGGAIWNDWGTGVGSSVFKQNKATIDGGALYNYNDVLTADLGVGGSELIGNTAVQYGGAIYSGGTVGSTPADLSVSQSQILTNTAVIDGGGVYNDQGTAELTDTILTNNQPDDCGPVNAVIGCTSPPAPFLTPVAGHTPPSIRPAGAWPTHPSHTPVGARNTEPKIPMTACPVPSSATHCLPPEWPWTRWARPASVR